MKTKIRILYLEDDQLDVDLACRALARTSFECDLKNIESEAELIDGVRAGEFDIILSDFYLPGFTGRKALHLAKSENPGLPFIFLSGKIGEDIAADLINEGASDFVLKDKLDRLGPAIIRAVRESSRSKEVRRLEAELKRIQRLIETSPDLFVTFNRSGILTYLNEHGRHLFEIGRQKQLEDINVQSLFPSIDWNQIFLKQSFEKNLKRDWISDVTFKGKSGELIVFSILIVAHTEDTDSDIVDFYSITGRDISSRMRVKEALRRSEERLSSIINSAFDAIITVDESNQITVFNASAERLFGHQAKDVLGKPLEILMPARFRGREAHWTARIDGDELQNHAKSFFGSVFGLCANGNEFPAEASISHVTVEGKRYYTVILRDISERVRALEERAGFERQLRRSQRLESVGTLAAGVAHDFNNILAAISINAEICKDELPVNNSSKEAIEAIIRACNRGGDLVRQIEAFCHQDEIKRVAVRPQKIIGEVVKLLRPMLPRSIEITTSLPDDVPAILANSSGLHEVIMNLCINAMHSMEESGGLLELNVRVVGPTEVKGSFGKTKHPGNHICLTVSDTGCGMTPDILERIFDPFFTTKAPGRGSGLGLSVVHGIVTAHDGVIDVVSDLGIGTTFYLYFPAVAVETPEMPSNSSFVLVGGGERILLIDDEIDICRAASKRLKRMGYDVSMFTDPKEALEEFKAFSDEFDLILTDLSMPELTGVELIREIFRLRPKIPVVLMSGYAAGQAGREAKELGVSCIIPKPFTDAEIGQVLHGLLRPKIN